MRARGAVNRFTAGIRCDPGHTMGAVALFAALRFSSVIFLLHPAPLSRSVAPCAQRPIIYSEFMLWRTHRVFPFVVSLYAQIKLGIMLYLTHNETLSFTPLSDNIKCHVRVHLQNKITAFGRPS